MSLIETVVEILVFVVLFGVLAMFFIVAVANRADPDPTGSRPMAAYLFSAAFLFLWVAYVGRGRRRELAHQPHRQPPRLERCAHVALRHLSAPSYRNAAIRACVLGAILVVFAGGAYLLHLRRGKSLATPRRTRAGPTKRVMRSYVALVSFVSDHRRGARAHRRRLRWSSS